MDVDGTMWLAFGSYWNGIYLMQLDPATGKRISANSTITHLAAANIEAEYIHKRGPYYYLFVNWDKCCAGIDSTYNIRIGRSTSVTGPYLDRNGVDMVNSGGSIFLESTGKYLGPGHAGILDENGTSWFTFHYYDGNDNGASKLGMLRLYWSADGWPVLTNDWSALYTFDADAREHSAQYNGTLQSGASVTNEPGRGNVLNLESPGAYVSLPLSVANANTFATWVKWNGGGDWQRIFDFGTDTTHCEFLTPRASAGVMRFAINTGGGEQQINAPFALPTNAWCHVAVTLDGANGVMYLNGNPIATNVVNIHPFYILARSNYLGKSQSAPDPSFNGRLDSFHIFGRALGAAEIKDLAWAHPALAHRYSFTNNAWDSIGMAHGRLMGNATVTNKALKLTGASGGYVNLPPGLVSGSSAVTLEFWATFGVNGNYARVFDTGTLAGSFGAGYFFSVPTTVPVDNGCR